MHFTRDKPALRRKFDLAMRRVKYALVAPVVSGVMRFTPWLDGDDAPPRKINYSADGDFIAQGDDLVAALTREFGPLDGKTILDIGCGIGRIATSLHRAKKAVQYHGFDIVKYGIVWCKKKMPQKDGFHFVHSNVFNPFYNPLGRISAGEYEFPYPDNKFDLLIAASVFTHLLEPDTRRYFEQSMRVMKADGKAYFTTFLVEDNRPETAHYALDHQIGAAYVERQEEPELAVGYTLAFWEALAAEHGAKISKVNPGMWRGAAGAKDYQDCLIIEKVTL